ncbi:MAG: hypothetical protein ACYC67_07600 [Prosthecobacter sp.]
MTPPSTPPPILSPTTLLQLSAILGSEITPERARLAIHHATQAQSDPLAQLSAAAAGAGMQIAPARLPLSEAVWQAHADSPVVIWSSVENRWLVITYAGWFSLRLADGSIQPIASPSHGRPSLTSSVSKACTPWWRPASSTSTAQRRT